MKIQKIQKIKEYKSFRDYSWHKFCNTECFHDKINLLYGENGSGKSSICNILKSVSQNKKFERYIPTASELLIDSVEYKFTNNNWDRYIDRDKILFFDREFVDKNVHLGHARGVQQGEQEQESGKIIIEFDAEAIRLRSVKNKSEEEKDKRNKAVEDYEVTNKTYLNFQLSPQEEKYFEIYKKKGEKEIKEFRDSLNNKITDLESTIKNDNDLLKKVVNIQTIQMFQNKKINVVISEGTVFQDVFNFDLKEQAQINAKQDLVKKILTHKDFFEIGFDIRKIHNNQCPFCQSTSEEQSINEIVDTYNKIYDDTYKKQKELFTRKKESLIDELNDIKSTIGTANIDEIFIPLKKISEEYKIDGIYTTKEEQYFRKPLSTKGINKLLDKLVGLDKPSKDNVQPFYNEAKVEFEAISKYFIDIFEYIDEKNNIIDNFKKDHTDIKIKDRIDVKKLTLEEIKQEYYFIINKKYFGQKSKLEKIIELTKLQKDLEKYKTIFKTAKEEYEKYCSKEAFSKILGKIETYFKNFNFSFKLQIDASRNTGLTKELPFAFKVLDLEGNERDMREGLSEGEIQVLSLCFFFAFLDIQKDKSQKVLIFDDPITSLDDCNLSSLVDLISEERDKFSQIFIFTHHRTFLKFLRKKFKLDSRNPDSYEYNILRNKDVFGGSFISKSKQERFVDKLKSFDTHVVTLAQNPNGFDIELKIVEYGQYLRYETEHFIKCKLLHWDKVANFADVIDGVKSNKSVVDIDLEDIKRIYSFCNWTTSHVDVGDDHGLSQLKEKINLFTGIYDKYPLL